MSLAHQIKQLQTKSQELQTIEGRIGSLKQQLQLQESNNHVIESRVNKILETKKHQFLDQMDLSNRLEKIKQQQEKNYNQIQTRKQQQADETLRIKEDMYEEKNLRKEIMKEQYRLMEMQLKQNQYNLQVLKQQQYMKIQEWKFRMKQEMELKKIEKIENIRNSQMEKKVELSIKLDQSQSSYAQRQEEEQQLLRNLQLSQLRFQSLKEDLNLAQKISIKDYTNSSVNISSRSFGNTKVSKQILNSPYAQIPSILKPKDVEHINILTRLQKPSFNEQSMSMERLSKRKVGQDQKIKGLLSDRAHTKETNFSKVDTEISLGKKPSNENVNKLPDINKDQKQFKEEKAENNNEEEEYLPDEEEQE